MFGYQILTVDANHKNLIPSSGTTNSHDKKMLLAFENNNFFSSLTSL